MHILKRLTTHKINNDYFVNVMFLVNV